MNLVCTAAHAGAEAATLPSNEDLRHMRKLSAPQLSPDGRQVLLQVTESTADGGLDHIWLIDAADRQPPRQLTFSPPGDKRGEHGARWMPDGRTAVFLAKRGEHVQLYRLGLDGGEARPFDLAVVPKAPPDDAGAVPRVKDAANVAPGTPVGLDIDDYAIAPDGNTVALVARDPESAIEKKRHDDKADAVLVDHDPHGKRLYLMDVAAGTVREAAVPGDMVALAWSRQGERLMAIAEAPDNASDLGPARSAWMVTAADPAHPAPVRQIPPSVSDGSWSADGRQFYFHAQSQADTPPGCSDVFLIDLATGSVRDLTARMAAAVVGRAPFAVGDAVYQMVQEGTREGLVRLGARDAQAVPLAAPVNRDFHCNDAATACVWLASGGAQPAALNIAERPDRPARRLATPAVVPANWSAVAPRLVHWASDGMTIEGQLYLPPAAAPGAPVPLIVDVHGGPTGAWVQDFNALVQFLLGQGWAVLLPNPRGSTGYGPSFVAANRNDLGAGDYRDIMAGVDAVLRDEPIDSRRMALIGYSYGGEMAGFVEGKSDRFKAIVSAAPVIDQHSEYGTEDSSWYDRWFYGKPWEHPADAWRQSPLAGVAHAVTPFLLLQGEADKTDPLGQSQEMYRALRQAGVPVQLVQYPREDHGPLAQGIYGMPSAEPWHGFDARLRIVKFISSAFARSTQ
jgi:dipeptidyl aminopeptidase/acylaminoacyl peptidase